METSTLFWTNVASDISTLVTLGIIITVLLALDFVRRFFMFGKH